MALSFVGFILHRFILCGFPLPWFYPTRVCSHTALSYVGFLSQAFILCGFHYTLLYPTGVSSHRALFYVGCLWWLYPMWVSSPCLYLMNVSSPGLYPCGFYLPRLLSYVGVIRSSRAIYLRGVFLSFTITLVPSSVRNWHLQRGCRWSKLKDNLIQNVVRATL